MSGDPGAGRLSELYLEAVELGAAERGALLDRVRGGDPELAARLARLLAADESAPSPIDRPAIVASTETTESATPPERVGPYRLLSELGRGGMGRVYLAEQETPDFRRTVALKLIDRPRFDDRAVRRFRDEVRILASLDHPGIVRFYDGGQSAEGVWYLALDYVEGTDLLRHASDQALDVDARLELVAAVAEAVAHAHARGVVHRDIKPANVLVGADGRPRLLDFGISKLAEPGEDAPGLTTLGAPRPLTPAYASPEQLAGSAATPASDVFSLGVVLYELLCGERPAADSRRASGSGIAPPSSRLRRSTTGDAGVSPAGLPAGSPAGRKRQARIGRELDRICLKALASDPGQRYADAGELAGELRSYLAARRQPPRWRLTVAALALVAAATGLYLARRETAPRPAAQSTAGTTGDARQFPFDPANPPPVAELEAQFGAAPDDVVAGAALAIRLERENRSDEADLIVGRLRQIPGRELDPLVDFAEGWISNRRKERQRALVFLTRARDGALAAGRQDLVGEIRGLRGSVLSALGQRDAAISELELALVAAERVGHHLFAYRTLNDLALEQLQKGEMAEGQALLERAVATAGRAGIRPMVALSNLAELHGVQGRPDLAAARLREILELRKLEPNARREAQVRLKLFVVERDLGHVEESDAELERALALLAGLDKEPDLAIALYCRAGVELDRGRFDRLDELLAGIRDVAKSTLDRRAIGFANEIEGRRDAARGEMAAARTRFADSRKAFLAQGDADLAGRTALVWGEAELVAGDGAEALRVLGEAKVGEGEQAVDDTAFRARLLRARAEAREGRVDAAASILAALPSAGHSDGSGPSLTRRLAWFAARGEIAAIRGRRQEARADFKRAADAAERCGRTVAALEMRIELAALEADAASARAAVAALEREAAELGLGALSRRARAALARLATSPAL